jgi:FMN phosphatase YigB (HAD superfamily)
MGLENNMLRSVVFIDLDHTLFEGTFESAVFPIVLGEISAQTGLSVPALKELARQENLSRLEKLPGNAIAAMDWDDIFATLAARLGANLKSVASELAQEYAHPPHISLHDGAHQALGKITARPSQRALVAATKGLRKYQLPTLTALNLLPYFDELITPDSHNAIKQERAFYGDWSQRADLSIMVGDTYVDDVLPAHSFGFKTIWRPDLPEAQALHSLSPFERPAKVENYPNDGKIRPDAIILNLAELPDVLEQIEQTAS